MRGNGLFLSALVGVLSVATACSTPYSRTRPAALYSILLLAALDNEDPELRYHATLALSRHDCGEVRTRLRSLLPAEDPMTRNAAARALADLGEENAAATLIANLHRDQRTFVTMDAIHHLRVLFGSDLGYDANRGYRHQTQALEKWWRWWEQRGHARPATPPPDDPFAAQRPTLLEQVYAFTGAPFTSEQEAWRAGKALWAALGKIAPSRNPDDIDVVTRGFVSLAERFPDRVDLWNNLGLAALNDGDVELALRAYDRATELAPNDAKLRNDLGILLEGMGRLEEALASYERAATLAPDDDIPRSNAGDVLAKLGRKEDAVRAWREAEHLAPEKWTYHRLWIDRLRQLRKL